MSAKAWIVDCKTSHLANKGRGDGITPELALGVAANSLWKVGDVKILNPNHGVPVVERKRVRTHDRFGVRNSLADLGDIDFTNVNLYPRVFVAGSRNSILRMFHDADQNPQLKVPVPHGIFVGVYREEHLVKKDTIVIEITCNKPRAKAKMCLEKSVGFKSGNFYSEDLGGKKKFGWNWFDITKETGITSSGNVTIHPRAIELPLKNIFDSNKWW